MGQPLNDLLAMFSPRVITNKHCSPFFRLKDHHILLLLSIDAACLWSLFSSSSFPACLGQQCRQLLEIVNDILLHFLEVIQFVKQILKFVLLMSSLSLSVTRTIGRTRNAIPRYKKGRCLREKDREAKKEREGGTVRVGIMRRED